MAQQLRELVSMPSTHMVVDNHPYSGPMGSNTTFWPPWAQFVHVLHRQDPI